MNFSNTYLTNQIIAYIGNKRKLLPLIYKAMEHSGIEIKPGLKFLDVFSGSGVVSRLAKSLNFEVYTNDWEYYSYILNKCYIETNNKELSSLFGTEEDFRALLDNINNLPVPEEKDCYISKYYAPRENNIEAVNYKTERLFYTRENALIIDKIRNYIENKYNNNPNDKEEYQKRNILLAQLIYEAATHNNTSGVFKAFHKGFGGYNKDALKRILGKIELHRPILIDSDYPVHVYQEDANELVKRIKNIDVAYLDPPYNQHQYGSNYHMLNTISKWDKIPAKLELNEKGELKEKAAIRHDWVKTRSDYCYKGTAVNSFASLIENLDSKYILISYSTDGIIPFNKLKDICIKKGKVSVVTNEYTTYRGGKQSNNRKNTNIEFILCINTAESSTKETEQELESIFIKKRFMLLFKEHFSQTRLKEAASKIDSNQISFSIEDINDFTVNTDYCFTISPVGDINCLSLNKINKIIELLESCICKTKENELEEIFYEITNNEIRNDRMWKLIPSTLKKLAYKKNKDVFYKWFNKVKELEQDYPEKYKSISYKLQEVEEQAYKRFYN